MLQIAVSFLGVFNLRESIVSRQGILQIMFSSNSFYSLTWPNCPVEYSGLMKSSIPRLNRQGRGWILMLLYSWHLCSCKGLANSEVDLFSRYTHLHLSSSTSTVRCLKIMQDDALELQGHWPCSHSMR